MSSSNNPWCKVTGGDQGYEYPEQQCIEKDRTGTRTIVFPYGFYCNLPDGEHLKALSRETALPFTQERPETERGEVVVFHPKSGAKIVFKNDGTIELTGDSFIVNADTVEANSETVTVNAQTIDLVAPTTTVQGDLTIQGQITQGSKNIGGNHRHPGDSGGTTGGVI